MKYFLLVQILVYLDVPQISNVCELREGITVYTYYYIMNPRVLLIAEQS